MNTPPPTGSIAAARRCCARRFSTAPEPPDCSPRAAPTAPRRKEDQLARLDAYLCDVKDLQIRDGLHVYGRAPDPQRREEFLASLAQSNPQVPADTLAARFDQAAAGEREALIAALDGKFVAPGPSGAPTRGRADVLPTGPQSLRHRSARRADSLRARARREGGQGIAPPPPPGSMATGPARW